MAKEKETNTVSEYKLPELPLKAPILTPIPSEKKSLLIKSVSKSTLKAPVQVPTQKAISIFLAPEKSTLSISLAERKSSLLDRIRAKASTQPISADRTAKKAAWDRGEWAISSLFMYLLGSEHD